MSKLIDELNKPCAKQTTLAILEDKNGNVIRVGTNFCFLPHKECPRKGMKSGEGYDKCLGVCKQFFHAEENVCLEHKDINRLKNATLYLIGHNYCCDRCIKVMKKAGVKKVVILGGLLNYKNFKELEI